MQWSQVLVVAQLHQVCVTATGGKSAFLRGLRVAETGSRPSDVSV